MCACVHLRVKCGSFQLQEQSRGVFRLLLPPFLSQSLCSLPGRLWASAPGKTHFHSALVPWLKLAGHGNLLTLQHNTGHKIHTREPHNWVTKKKKSPKYLILFYVRLWFCVGPQSELCCGTCGPWDVGWPRLREAYFTYYPCVLVGTFFSSSSEWPKTNSDRLELRGHM